MKIIAALLIFAIMCGCTTINSVTPENTQPPPTFTPTSSITPLPTKVPSVTPTSVPKCNDQYLGDLSIQGIPESSSRKDGPGLGFLDFNETEFFIYSKVMHDRTVTIAIHKNTGTRQKKQMAEFSNYVFDTWALYWREFGGFPFSSYSIVIGLDLPYDADIKGYGEYGSGYESSQSITQWGEYWSHGIYHAWLGNGFRQYNDERWLMEGVTQYYGNRQSRNPGYIELMHDSYNKYINAFNNGRDIPLNSINHVSPSSPQPDNLHYWKGALVAYLLDLELKKTGHHLGEVMQDLYQNFGVAYQGYPTDQDILKTFNYVSGEDFSALFDKYIFGTEPLPIDPNNFIWVCHDSSIYIHPTIGPTKVSSLPYVLDGASRDWQDLTMIHDPTGDSISGDTDISGFAFAQDENFLDIFLETDEKIREKNVNLDIEFTYKDSTGNVKEFKLNVNSEGVVFGGNYPDS